jgi:hypothetical protein
MGGSGAAAQHGKGTIGGGRSAAFDEEIGATEVKFAERIPRA